MVDGSRDSAECQTTSVPVWLECADKNSSMGTGVLCFRSTSLTSRRGDVISPPFLFSVVCLLGKAKERYVYIASGYVTRNLAESLNAFERTV